MPRAVVSRLIVCSYGAGSPTTWIAGVAAFAEGEAAMMLPSQRPGRRRAVVGAVGAVALAGATFLGSAAAASAEPPTPPPPVPPNCSPADWAGLRAGVAAALSV